MNLKNPTALGQCALFYRLVIYNIPIVSGLVGSIVRTADVHEFPFIAAILRRNQRFNAKRDLVCTGTLVTRKDILTAEHCFEDEVTEGLRVIVGSIDIRSPNNYYPSWWLSYMYWSAISGKSNGCVSNDISMLRLTTSVDDTVSTAQLSFTPYADIRGKSILIMGWGESNNETYPTLLQTAKVKIISNSVCRRKGHELSGSYYAVDANLFCSSASPYALFMGGDSGGPAVYQNKVVAVNTGTFPNPEIHFHPKKMNMHTNLYFYDEYYQSVINYL